jgi:hypothetical protein
MAKTYVVKQEKSSKGSGSAKARIWDNVKFFARSLFSNDACVEARKKPWYSAVIIALISTVVALITIMYSAFTSTGASFFNTPLYNLDNALVDFDNSLVSKNISAKISNQTLTISITDWNAAYGTKTTLAQDNPNHAYVHEYQQTVLVYPTSATSSSTSSDSVSSTSQPTTPYTKTITTTDLAVYWAGSTDLATYYTNYVWGQAVAFPTNTSKTNIIVLGEKGFIAYKLPTSYSSQASKLQGKWDVSTLEGFDLRDLATKSSHGVAYTSSDTIENQTIAAYKELFADTYNSTKITNAWISTGIYAGVYVGLALLLGLTVFLMTRGKTNPFRIYTFWECQKIAYWASFSPAVLSLFGFLALSYAPLFYIFLFGMRVMWMSMKSLRPIYDEQ